MALKKVTRGCNKNFKRFDTTSSFVFQAISPRFPLFCRDSRSRLSAEKIRRRNILPRFPLPPFRRKKPAEEIFCRDSYSRLFAEKIRRINILPRFPLPPFRRKLYSLIILEIAYVKQDQEARTQSPPPFRRNPAPAFSQK